MNVPPPPPPPPVGTNIKAPVPASNKALLSSIEKGTKLKKVPDTLKNDRSSALVGSEVGKSSSSSQQARPINGMNMNASDQQSRQSRGFQSIQSELANQLAQFGSGSAKKPIQVAPSSSLTRPQFRGGAPPHNQMAGSATGGIRPPPPPPSNSKPMPFHNSKPGPPPPVISNKPQVTSANNRAPPPPQPLNKKPVAPRLSLAEPGNCRSLFETSATSAPAPPPPQQQQCGAAASSRRAVSGGFPSATGGPGGGSETGSGAQRVVRVTGNPPPPMPNVARDPASSRLSYPNPGLGAPPPPVPQRVAVTPHHSRPPAAWGPPAGGAAPSAGHQYAVQDRPPPPPVPPGKHVPTQRGPGSFDRRFCFPDERQFPRWGGQAPGVPFAQGGGGARHSQALSAAGAGELHFNYR